MRIKNMALLAIALFGSAPVWGQTAKDAPSAAPTVAPGATTLPFATISIAAAAPAVPEGSAPAAPAVPEVSAPAAPAVPEVPAPAVPEVPAPAAPAMPGIPGPLDYPTIGENNCPVPSNCVPQSFWLHADYLYWVIHKDNSGPLIQAVPASQAISGVINPAAAATLFPANGRLTYDGLSGVRVDTGMWIDTTNHIGVEIGGFDTTQVSKSGFVASNALGLPALARFYTNANSGVPTELFFSNPDPANTYSGTLAANSTVNSVYSGEISARWQGYRFASDNLDWLAGFRYFHLDDKLSLNGTALLSDGTKLSVSDQFKTQNNFYGAQGGISARWCGMYGFSFDFIFKLAMGDMNQRVTIAGSNTLVTPDGVASTEPYGLYARPSNVGTYQRDHFAVIPELTFNLNYNVTEHVAIFAGWNFIYMNNAVVRAANQIDKTVNDSQIRYIANPTMGNAPGPVFSFRDQTFWMEGLNAGVRFEY